MKEKIVLIFQPAWSCPALLAPLCEALESSGVKAVVVENPATPISLAKICKHNLQIAASYRNRAQIVGLGISQGTHALSLIVRNTSEKGMNGVVFYGSPMLSRRPTLKSFMVLLRIIFTPAYWGIFAAVFSRRYDGEIRLKRKDVVKLLFGEDREEWKHIIDEVSRQKASARVLLEMMICQIRRVTYNMPVRIIRASDEVFHSNSGALTWLKKKPHYHSRDAYRVIKGHHFSALVNKNSLAEVVKEVISLFN